MLKLEVIGNLGSNAEVKVENGRPFVSMSIAHTTSRVDGNGTRHESTIWVSATLNGDGGQLLKYLVKGAKVRVYGDASVRTYHSEKQRALVAGLNVYARDIDLLPSNVDPVPRVLYDTDGVENPIGKFYLSAKKNCVLYSQSGQRFIADKKGWVTPEGTADANAAQDSSQNNDSNDKA